MNLAAGIMITASHNPPEWNGFKVKESFGGSALPETTKEIEVRLTPSIPLSVFDGEGEEKGVRNFDPNPAYLKHILSLVDLDLINKSGIKFIIDPMHGSGIGYLKGLLGEQVIEINNRPDPLFGGVNPEPLPINLNELTELCKESNLNGLALDGDADRISGVSADGAFINTHNVFSLLLKHLVENRKAKGAVVKTFNITRLVEKQCQKYNLILHETPIGFKHIARHILKEEIILGGEESGGYGTSMHLPERDGVLNALLLMELMAIEKKGLGEILNSIMSEFGYYYYDRMDLHTEKAQAVVKSLTDKPPLKIGDLKITKIEDLDGIKLNFEDESWILFRASGTEPLLRIYVEARSEEQVGQLLAEGKKLTINWNRDF